MKGNNDKPTSLHSFIDSSLPIAVPVSIVPVPVPGAAPGFSVVEEGRGIINSDTPESTDPKPQENRKRLLWMTLVIVLLGTFLTLYFQDFKVWGGGGKNNDWSQSSNSTGGRFSSGPIITPTTAPISHPTFRRTSYPTYRLISTPTPTYRPTPPTLLSSEDYQMLDYNVIDAEYSKSMDSIILVSSNPNKIHIFDSKTGAETGMMTLDLPPTCVSVGPNGNDAAVGHNGWVSYVDLAGGTIANGESVKTIPVATDVFDVVLSGNGFIHAFPRVDQWVNIHSIEIETGKETKSQGTIRERTRAKLHPSGMKIYGVDNGLSPSDIERYDISSGTAVYSYDSPYHGDWPISGDLWFSDDGELIFVKGRTVLRSSDDTNTDMTYRGLLDGNNARTSIQALDNSSKEGKIVLIPSDSQVDNQIEIYDDSFLLYVGTLMLPPFPNTNPNGFGFFQSHGKFVFFDANGEHLHVIVQGSDQKYAIIKIPTSLAVEYVNN